jgi:hypothetical protein
MCKTNKKIKIQNIIMKSRTKQLVRTISLDSLKNTKDYGVLSEKQMRLIFGGNGTQTTSLAATIRSANSL